MLNIIKKHPPIWFYVIAVLIEIAIIPLFILTQSDRILLEALERTGLPFKTDLISAIRLVLTAPETFPALFLSIVQVAAVDIAVFIVARIVYGRNGIADLQHRFRFWRQGIRWQSALKIWGSCILVFSLINLAGAGLNYGLFSSYFVWNVDLAPFSFLGHLVITLFLDAGGLFEENGWRGFALPLLLQQFNPLKASVIVGLLWGAWHFPVKFNLFFAYGVAGALLYLATFTLRLIFVSIIMTRFWNRLGQTTIVAIAMHGLINDSIGLGGTIESEAFIPQLFAEINLLIPTAIAALYLIVQTKGRLSLATERRYESRSTRF